MRGQATIERELQKAIELNEEVMVVKHTFLDTDKMTQQAMLLGVLTTLAWVLGYQDSPVTKVLKQYPNRRKRK